MGQHQRLGRYELIRPLARGGMAELYLARVQGLEGFEKLVVIKRILPELSSNEAFRRMFLDEVRIASTLTHANIAQVYEFGEERGRFYFSMEYAAGIDVSRLVSRCRALGRRIPLEHALKIVIGLCSGLHYAHERTDLRGVALGVVHRDVSPQNIVVTFDGEVKIIDFGIAHAARRLAETTSGTLKGKAPYMSPEQCRALPLDRRSDVFSASILLWELTTGTRLYARTNDFETLKAIVDELPRVPSSVDPHYPAELEKIVLTGLRHSPEKRHQSAQDLQVLLEEFCRDKQLGTSSVGLGKFIGELFDVETLRRESMVSVPIELEVDETQGPDSVSRQTRGLSPRETRPSPWRTRLAVAGLTSAVGLAVGLAFAGRRPTVVPTVARAAAQAAVQAPSASPEPPSTIPRVAASVDETTRPVAKKVAPVIRASAHAAERSVKSRAPDRPVGHRIKQVELDALAPPR